MDIGGGWIEALVQGTDTYEVMIDVDRSQLRSKLGVSCTCPYFGDFGDLCKHIWATLLAIDEQRLMPVPTGPMDIRTRCAEGGGDTESRIDRAKKQVAAISARRQKRGPAEWSRFLSDLAARSYDPTSAGRSLETSLDPIYVLEAGDDRLGSASMLTMSLAQRSTLKNGSLGKQKKLSLKPADIERIDNALDRHICLMLVGASPPENRHYTYGYYGGDMYRPAASTFQIPAKVWHTLLPMLFETGKFQFRPGRDREPVPLRRDEGGPWEFVVALDRLNKKSGAVLSGKLRRGDETRELGPVQCYLPGDPAFMVGDNTAFDVTTNGCSNWLAALHGGKQLVLDADQVTPFIRQLSKLERLPPIVWPEGWKIAEVRDIKPKPELRLSYNERGGSGQSFANATVGFRYDNIPIEFRRPGATILDVDSKRQIHRDIGVEENFLRRMLDAGVERDPYSEDFRIRTRLIPQLVRTLLSQDWTVLGNNKLFKNHQSISIRVSSGIDWFDLDGQVDFDGLSVSVPELLRAAREGKAFVKLGDASMGMIPEKWLAKFGDLLELGNVEGNQVRFAKTQIGLIDALLAEMPEASFDANLAAARRKLNEFNGIKPRQAPRGFKGALRDYQKQGLGWLHFLRQLGWGGCLADDMGLGKTVQALALLRQRRRNGDPRCSLIVVPKSIVFNWMREAKRFTPTLKIIDYTGIERRALRDKFDSTDIVITTYGTLKRDIEFLADREFHYVILDEAQAIKNPKSQNAKAARALNARQRLVMTGTPVENRLEDLWSLFEFLNPGMLGSSRNFARSFSAPNSDDGENSHLTALQRMLRPFILRRTKERVAPDLPKRSEQIVDCAMGKAQAKYYGELRDYYRGTLLEKVDRLGLAKSKIHVLEALLRLRQAACHPGLIDRSRAADESTKLDSMIPMIEELVSEGHKALIFSQFTAMLSLTRDRLDKIGMVYEYLDGKTRKRESHVDRFQDDPDCPLFLISLKAGGVGLNLTAADYVFIMDPWWNPAVEAQAIDRTHRIGQDKSVLAYRLITRDTVEAKIMELQKSKRALANAVITQDNSLIRNLTREDLDILLS